jgi:hypothetical protein
MKYQTYSNQSSYILTKVSNVTYSLKYKYSTHTHSPFTFSRLDNLVYPFFKRRLKPLASGFLSSYCSTKYQMAGLSLQYHQSEVSLRWEALWRPPPILLSLADRWMQPVSSCDTSDMDGLNSGSDCVCIHQQQQQEMFSDRVFWSGYNWLFSQDFQWEWTWTQRAMTSA